LKTLSPGTSSPLEATTKPPSFRILGSRVDRLALPDILKSIREFTAETSPHQVITANTLMLLAAEKDPELRAVIENASLVVPESSGILWASRRLGAPLSGIVPGIDLLTSICAQVASERRSVYLLGARPGAADRAAIELTRHCSGLQIAGTRHGYFSQAEETNIIAAIRKASPTFLFVGMAIPHQEKWIARHLVALNVPVVMGVGGSFDVLSGQLDRAPAWMQRAGIEWAYRLMQEPWRWRRIAQLPVFAWKVLRTAKMENGKLSRKF